MMKKFSSIYDNIDRTSTVNRTSQYPALTQLGLAAINKSTLEDLVSYYDTLTDNLGKSLYNENNDYSTDIYNKSGSSGEVDMVEMSELKENLTDEQIEEIFDLIAENEGLDTDGTSSASAGTINLQLLQSKDPTILNLFGISDLANILNIYPTTATNILRTDLITGGLYDSDTYTGRYGNLDDYLSYYILNDYDSNLISNAMDDYMTVVSIDDYYITNINYEYAESTTYNQYKFELYDLDTEEMLMSYETNSNHIKFSGVEAGTYLVKSYKAKTDAKSIRVYYSKADYLVDAGTNTILYSKIETAGTTDGISCLNYVEIMNDSEDSWEYLDEDDVTLNSLGEVESNTGTERVK
ncbi:MAG: hypothetical protein LUG21_07485 [Clostridiales bacterium]|nr:hypothetical protein [Clostridiales bacterium]